MSNPGNGKIRWGAGLAAEKRQVTGRRVGTSRVSTTAPGQRGRPTRTHLAQVQRGNPVEVRIPVRGFGRSTGRKTEFLVISPLLLNVALHGMEQAAGIRYRRKGRAN